MKRLINFGVLCCLVGASASTAENGRRTTTYKPCVTITGADSKVSEPSYHRILSKDAWAKVWQQHKGQKNNARYDYFYDPLGIPLVDFDEYMVIAIFQGSGGNSAGLVAEPVSEKEDRIVFRFDDKAYQTMTFGSGSDGGAKKVTAYGFFVIPRSTKAVVLEENVQNLIGQPPVWKARIRFEAAPRK